MAVDDDGGAVVVDTMVFSWMFGDLSTEPRRTYATLLQGRPLVLAAQTVAELRAGARMRSWGDKRRADLDERIRRVSVASVDNATVNAYVDLKVECTVQGLGFDNKVHDGDRWIAATAIRFGLPLVSHDTIFLRVPGLSLITELPPDTPREP